MAACARACGPAAALPPGLASVSRGKQRRANPGGPKVPPECAPLVPAFRTELSYRGIMMQLQHHLTTVGPFVHALGLDCLPYHPAKARRTSLSGAYANSPPSDHPERSHRSSI
jgi:hypothetical protein